MFCNRKYVSDIGYISNKNEGKCRSSGKNAIEVGIKMKIIQEKGINEGKRV